MDALEFLVEHWSKEHPRKTRQVCLKCGDRRREFWTQQVEGADNG